MDRRGGARAADKGRTRPESRRAASATDRALARARRGTDGHRPDRPKLRYFGYSLPMFLLLVACNENNLIGKEVPSEGMDTGTLPDIVVDPGEIAFGEVEWGSEHTQVVTVENVGSGTLLLESPALVSATAEVSLSTLGSAILAPGAKTEMVVTWVATSAAGVADIVQFGSNDPDEPVVDVPLSGSVPVGQIVVTPDIHDFGALEVGLSDAVTVNVKNVGNGPLTIDSYTFVATDVDLALVDPGALAGLPLTLAPGESTDVLVNYAPSDGSGDEGTFAVFSDDPDTYEAGTVFMGSGIEPDPCEGFTQNVKLTLTADDAWQGWLDGAGFGAPGQNAWNQIDSLEWDLECGDHALALYATDTAQVIAGVLAAIEVEGTVTFVSGGPGWTMIDTAPAADWTDIAFDDSAWHIPEKCGNASIWGSTPQPLYDLGAQWIWWTPDCTNLGEAWLRLNFTVP